MIRTPARAPTSLLYMSTLIWMFHGKGVNSKINHIHERALRIAYQDFTSSFAELLINDNSISIHQRNLQLLVTEIYRTKMNINPSYMKEIFVEREIHYSLRVMNSVYARKLRTTAYGLETVSFLGQNLFAIAYKGVPPNL